jgi:hypothetical protein
VLLREVWVRRLVIRRPDKLLRVRIKGVRIPLMLLPRNQRRMNKMKGQDRNMSRVPVSLPKVEISMLLNLALG